MKRQCISELVDEVPFIVPCEESRAEFFLEIPRCWKFSTRSDLKFSGLPFAIADIPMNMQVKFSEPQN